ncbi:MAG: serine/threonine-protein kinase [Planctomycetota bacterium]|jgi:serine/threonine protein kinase
MIARDHLTLMSELERLYADATDPGFDDVCHITGVPSDGPDLAELIESDGRMRLRLGRPVGLQRYLDAVPDLGDRSEPLDAAIDMALRQLVRDGCTEQEAVVALIERHPDHRTSIREAAELNNALWSTTRLRANIVSRAVQRDLPAEFGPHTTDGHSRYELLELLGEGAFGQVYLAVDRQLSEEGHRALVSVKVLNPAEDDGDDADGGLQRHRLTEEATKARRIDHPHVVRVLDRGVSADDEDFVVYEYVAGGDLARWRRRRGGALPVEQAVRMAIGMARGMHAAHMAGLVHCDLKPANVMVTPEGEVRVADFGIAIRVAEADQRQRELEAGGSAPSGEAPLSNPAFISPEQYRREPGSLTVPSDIYALGGLLFWLLTSRLPNGSTAEEIRLAHDPVHGRREPPAARDDRPEVDADLDAICRRAMARDAGDRQASASALADDLETWLRRQPISWTRPSAWRRTSLWVRRKPALAVSLAIIVALAVGGGPVLMHFMLQNAEARGRLRAENQKLRQADEQVDSIMGLLREARDEGFTSELLPMMWLFEWMFAPTLMQQRIDWNDVWRMRIDTIRAQVESARATGRGNDLETLMWESALVFWLVDGGDWREAQPLLARNVQAWAAVLPDDDRWRERLDTLRVCAEVNRYEQERTGNADAWRDAATRLEAARPQLAAGDRRAPIHRLVLERLATLYGSRMLDDTERLAEVRKRLADWE